MTVNDLDIDDIKTGLADGSILLVDVREPHEFAAGHIPGSVSRPLSRFDPADLPNEPGKRLVLSCAAGVRSLRAMEFAQSAAAALQCIANAEDTSLILILSDINMPEMSGLELLPKAKAARPDVPIIMITAYGDAETKRKALEGGAEALLIKPIDFGLLRNEIETRVMRAA